ncbi:DUF1992 domain-containing protein [Ilumatobacter sp.]|uniref:DnaJ family domain-containing protein n=1 Tax=Ilumatobacter sp. TaxID=1967498 RepID=UPI003B517C62
MTERKPSNVSWESWIERQIRDGQRDGAFDDLPGRGRPMPGLDEPHDEMWWVKRKMRSEDVRYVPPSIAVRAERDEAIRAAMASTREADVVERIERLNVRIRYVNSHATAGPPTTVAPVDVAAILERWRAERPLGTGPDAHADSGSAPDPRPDGDPDRRSETPAPVPRRPLGRGWWRRARRGPRRVT